MKQVRIAELKSHLSEYLRAVKRGETIQVLDRDTPVAEIIPSPKKPQLRIQKPKRGSPPPGQVPLPPPLGLDTDIVALLMEERKERR